MSSVERMSTIASVDTTHENAVRFSGGASTSTPNNPSSSSASYSASMSVIVKGARWWSALCGAMCVRTRAFDEEDMGYE
jgi:hypothetical protein